jgi:hypothetical protein
MRHRFLLASFALVVIGCGSSSEPIPSTDLATADLRLSASVRSNGSTAQAIATIADPMGAVVDLSGGDRLLFSEKNGADVEMVEVEHEYLAQLMSGATDFSLILERASGERSPTDLSLPPPFALSVPLVEAPRSTPIPIVWDTGQGDYLTTLTISGPCLSSSIVRSLSPDPGSFAIQPADLFVQPGTLACGLDVTLERSIQTTVNARQIREATIATVP